MVIPSFVDEQHSLNRNDSVSYRLLDPYRLFTVHQNRSLESKVFPYAQT